MHSSDHEPADSQLVAEARSGDAASFAKLVERYAPLAFATARSRAVNQATVPDAVQEAFTTAFERLHLLRQPERFGPWLRKLVVSECARVARQEKRNARGTTQLVVVSSGTEQVDLPVEQHDGELARAALRLLQELPPAQQEAATLCLVQGVPRSEAAAFLGIKETTLRKRLHDARKRLQAQVFELAKATLREDQLPPGFARRCVCRCERSRRQQ